MAEKYFDECCSVTKVTTLIPGKDVGTTKGLVNKLITFYEEETVDFGQNGKVTYPRLNHIDFSYQISIENPRKTHKKVIVRLWLGLSTDSEDPTSSYNQINFSKYNIYSIQSDTKKR